MKMRYDRWRWMAALPLVAIMACGDDQPSDTGGTETGTGTTESTMTTMAMTTAPGDDAPTTGVDGTDDSSTVTDDASTTDAPTTTTGDDASSTTGDESTETTDAESTSDTGTGACECGPDEYCEWDDGQCGETGGGGICMDRPQGCRDVWDPVCGCDGQTYSNECDAHMGGVDVAFPGECDDPPPPPGCENDCGPDEYCELPVGQCGGDDGVCQAMPDACLAVYDPVCGCDGLTYGNDCEAASVGVNVDYAGECDDEPMPACEGCGPDQYCQLPPGQCDAIGGTCQDTPDVCNLVFAPVCGCDGMTYSNACFAQAAGVNIDHDGPC